MKLTYQAHPNATKALALHATFKLNQLPLAPDKYPQKCNNNWEDSKLLGYKTGCAGPCVKWINSAIEREVSVSANNNHRTSEQLADRFSATKSTLSHSWITIDTLLQMCFVYGRAYDCTCVFRVTPVQSNPVSVLFAEWAGSRFAREISPIPLCYATWAARVGPPAHPPVDNTHRKNTWRGVYLAAN
jgi:hypothetical protein